MVDLFLCNSFCHCGQPVDHFIEILCNTIIFYKLDCGLENYCDSPTLQLSLPAQNYYSSCYFSN